MKYIKSFESTSNNSKYSVGDKVRTKSDISDLLEKGKGNGHPLYKINDNTGIDKFLSKDATITNVVLDKKGYYRYYIDIDNGDYWWVDECFE